MMQFAIIASPDDVRVRGFQAALHHQGIAPAIIINWQDILTGQKHLAELIPAASCVRIESPGKDALTNQLLLERGYAIPDEDGDYTRVGNIPDDKGLIIAPRQWYLGLWDALQCIQNQLEEAQLHHRMNHPDEIALMFDKIACHTHLQKNDIAVPPALPRVACFDELETAMYDTGFRRVFVKPAHGSSASGVVALETNGTQYKATAAIEMLERDGKIALYNTRKIRTYRNYGDIRKLMDTLCRHRVHVEAWIPKARMHDKSFDLRVVVIDGQAAHVLARLSKSPMTNLHLLNERQQRETVIECMGDKNFQRAMRLCEETMQLFPKSLYAGMDLLVGRDTRKHYILEVNAFGDLLHNTTFKGMDTYTMEIERMVARYEHG